LSDLQVRIDVSKVLCNATIFNDSESDIHAFAWDARRARLNVALHGDEKIGGKLVLRLFDALPMLQLEPLFSRKQIRNSKMSPPSNFGLSFDAN